MTMACDAGLDALQKPLLHLHTPANVALPWSEIDFDFMNLNTGESRSFEPCMEVPTRARVRPLHAATTTLLFAHAHK